MHVAAETCRALVHLNIVTKISHIIIVHQVTCEIIHIHYSCYLYYIQIHLRDALAALFQSLGQAIVFSIMMCEIFMQQYTLYGTANTIHFKVMHGLNNKIALQEQGIL